MAFPGHTHLLLVRDLTVIHNLIAFAMTNKRHEKSLKLDTYF